MDCGVVKSKKVFYNPAPPSTTFHFLDLILCFKSMFEKHYWLSHFVVPFFRSNVDLFTWTTSYTLPLFVFYILILKLKCSQKRFHIWRKENSFKANSFCSFFLGCKSKKLVHCLEGGDDPSFETSFSRKLFEKHTSVKRHTTLPRQR